jgi:hypothetical protein
MHVIGGDTIGNWQWGGFLALTPWTSVSIVISNISLALLSATHLPPMMPIAKPSAEPSADLVSTSELSFMIWKHTVCITS